VAEAVAVGTHGLVSGVIGRWYQEDISFNSHGDPARRVVVMENNLVKIAAH